MQVQDDVGARQHVAGGGEHAGLEGVGRVEQAGQVVEDVLGVAVGAETDDRQAGRLGLGAHDGQVLADEGIQEAGLADVGVAGEGDDAGAWHGGKVPMDMRKPQRTDVRWGFRRGGWRRPTLPRPRERSTIGAAGLNCRVRNGNGCGPCALVVSQRLELLAVSHWLLASG